MPSNESDSPAVGFPVDPRARLRRALVACLWLSFAYFGSTPSWNPNSRFNLVRSIVEQQTLAIDAYHQNTGDKSYRHGHHYSDKAPGLALLAVPIHGLRVFAFGGDGGLGALYLVTVVLVGGASVATALAMLHVLERLGAHSSRALCIVLAYSLATPAFAYSTLFFGHQVAAAFAFLAFVVAQARPTRHWAALTGLLSGLAFICEYATAIAVAAVLFYVFWRQRAACRRERLATLARISVGALLPLGLAASYNTICFGAPWAIGYANLVPSEFSEGMGRGLFGVTAPRADALWGITFGGMRGLFHIFPITLVALLGLLRAAWRGSWRLEARICLAVVLGFLWLNSSYVFWHGGASFGPRHLVPMLPFVALGLLGLPRRRACTAAAVLIGVFSWASAIAGTAVGADLPEYGRALWDHIWPRVAANEVPYETQAYNLGMAWNLEGNVALAPLLLFWMSALPLLWRSSRRAERGSHEHA